jgi:hypothetical protein
MCFDLLEHIFGAQIRIQRSDNYSFAGEGQAANRTVVKTGSIVLLLLQLDSCGRKKMKNSEHRPMACGHTRQLQGGGCISFRDR